MFHVFLPLESTCWGSKVGRLPVQGAHRHPSGHPVSAWERGAAYSHIVTGGKKDHWKGLSAELSALGYSAGLPIPFSNPEVMKSPFTCRRSRCRYTRRPLKALATCMHFKNTTGAHNAINRHMLGSRLWVLGHFAIVCGRSQHTVVLGVGMASSKF